MKITVLSFTLQFYKKQKMLKFRLRFMTYGTNALLDSGAVQSEMSKSELREVTAVHLETVQRELPAPMLKNLIANVNLVKL